MQPAPRPQRPLSPGPQPSYPTQASYQNVYPTYAPHAAPRDPRYPNVYPMRPQPNGAYTQPHVQRPVTPVQSDRNVTYDADKRERLKLGIIVGFFAIWVLISVLFVGIYLFKAV